MLSLLQILLPTSPRMPVNSTRRRGTYMLHAAGGLTFRERNKNSVKQGYSHSLEISEFQKFVFFSVVIFSGVVFLFFFHGAVIC